MSKNFETMIATATSQFFTTIQNDLVDFIWEKTNQDYSKEKLSQAMREFFGEKLEKVEVKEKVEEKTVTKKKKKDETDKHTCERKITTGEKADTICGKNASEQVEGTWVCGKHKSVKAKKSSKKKVTGFLDGFAPTKKIAGGLPNETVPADLAHLCGEMDNKLSEQIDNYNIVTGNVPLEITEDNPSQSLIEEKPVEQVVIKEDKKQEIVEEKKEVEEKPKKTKPVETEVEVKKPTIMLIPSIEEMEKLDENPKPKKKVIKRVVKKKDTSFEALN